MSKNAKLSIIIPTIEEEAIFTIIKRLKEIFPMGLEIIVVDKSSERYYRKLLEAHVKVIRQKDKGVENAIMLGLRNAKGSILASIDADGTHDLSGIAAGVEMVRKGEADLVLGNRFGKLGKGSMSPHIAIGNKLISKVYDITYQKKIHDVLTGLFVMNRKAFEAIKNVTPYRAGIAFFAIELANRGFEIKEVPIEYYKRTSGESKLTNSKVLYGIKVTSHIIRLARDYNPLLIFGTLGVILLVSGFALGGYILYSFITSGTFTLIGRSLIAFMLVISGILSVIAGFILDLLLEISKKINNK
jgi:dolichol-phosphate mannosyltransferase